jgi:hypothetical protein
MKRKQSCRFSELFFRASLLAVETARIAILILLVLIVGGCRSDSQAPSELQINIVVSDDDYSTWNAYAANAWPTLFVLDKQGRVRWGACWRRRVRGNGTIIQKLLAEGDPHIAIMRVSNGNTGLYGASVLGLCAFRKHDLESGGLTQLEVEVRSSVKHTLTVTKVREWLERGVRRRKKR